MTVPILEAASSSGFAPQNSAVSVHASSREMEMEMDLDLDPDLDLDMNSPPKTAAENGRETWSSDEIFSPSPLIKLYLDIPSPPSIPNAKTPKGMRTKLYPYQLNSMHAMLRRERFPKQFLDPAASLGESVDHPLSNLYIPKPDVYEDIRGGIVCEDMGTGKTLICLALVLATLHEWCSPPSDCMTSVETMMIEESMTPDERHYLQQQQEEEQQQNASRIPSLKELASKAVKLQGVDYLKANLPVDLEAYMKNQQLYYLETHEEPGTTRVSRESFIKKTFLSSTTLVVVPEVLIYQWQNEINLHINDAAIKSLVIAPEAKTPLPSAEELCTYDLVLITQQRFSKEYSPGTYSRKGQSSRTAAHECPNRTLYLPCRCPTQRTISPLQQVRWKRLIFDEGHSVAQKFSGLALVGNDLNVERRWICTGTPTANLSNFDNDDQSQSGTHSGDLGDLARLHMIFKDFLKLEPFKSQSNLFSQAIQAPFLRQYRPILSENQNNNHNNSNNNHEHLDYTRKEQVQATTRLQNLMSRIMIKNREEDWSRDVQLPPLHERTVLVDFEYQQLLTYNVQVAMIHANAVLSQRVDQDYLFHANNIRGATRLLLTNIWHSCFWYSSLTTRDDVDPTLKSVEEGISKQSIRGYNQQDRDLLQQIRTHLLLAKSDTSWEIINGLESVPYYVRHFPLFGENFWDAKTSMRRGKEWFERDMADLPHLTSDQYNGGCLKNPIRIDQDGDGATTQVQPEGRRGLLSVLEGNHVLALRKVLQIKESLDSDNNLRPDYIYKTTIPNVPALARRVLSHSKIVSSSSTKLNYLLGQILLHSPKEKCIIFCQDDNHMIFIKEALDLVQVMYKIFTKAGDLSARAKADLILTFNTSDDFRVLLMHISRGAHGINLPSASRVYFVSPVWNHSVERQAIKRAHRIGQTKPVYVETLVVRDSFEEQLVERRQRLHQEWLQRNRSRYGRWTVGGGERGEEDGIDLEMNEPDGIGSMESEASTSQSLPTTASSSSSSASSSKRKRPHNSTNTTKSRKNNNNNHHNSNNSNNNNKETSSAEFTKVMQDGGMLRVMQNIKFAPLPEWAQRQEHWVKPWAEYQDVDHEDSTIRQKFEIPVVAPYNSKTLMDKQIEMENTPVEVVAVNGKVVARSMNTKGDSAIESGSSSGSSRNNGVNNGSSGSSGLSSGVKFQDTTNGATTAAVNTATIPVIATTFAVTAATSTVVATTTAAVNVGTIPVVATTISAVSEQQDDDQSRCGSDLPPKRMVRFAESEHDSDSDQDNNNPKHMMDSVGQEPTDGEGEDSDLLLLDENPFPQRFVSLRDSLEPMINPRKRKGKEVGFQVHHHRHHHHHHHGGGGGGQQDRNGNKKTRQSSSTWSSTSGSSYGGSTTPVSINLDDDGDDGIGEKSTIVDLVKWEDGRLKKEKSQVIDLDDSDDEMMVVGDESKSHDDRHHHFSQGSSSSMGNLVAANPKALAAVDLDQKKQFKKLTQEMLKLEEQMWQRKQEYSSSPKKEIKRCDTPLNLRKIKDDDDGDQKSKKMRIKQELALMELEMKNEHLKDEDIKDEDIKDEDIKDEDIKDEDIKNEDIKDEDIKDEDVKDEDVKDEDVKDEDVKDEDVKDEDVKDEDIKDESIKDEHVKDEHIKHDHTK